MDISAGIANLTLVFQMIVTMITTLLELFLQPPLIFFVALSIFGAGLAFAKKAMRGGKK